MTTMSVTQDYIKQLLEDRTTIPFYLDESNWDSTFLEIIEKINSGTNLSFVRNTDNTDTIIDIYIYQGMYEPGWSTYVYDSYLALELTTEDATSTSRIEELFGEMLGTALGLQEPGSIDNAAIEELKNIWGGSSLNYLSENIEVSDSIDSSDEVDTYTITIDEDGNLDRYIVLNIDQESADLDLSLNDSYGTELANAQTTNQTELIDLSDIEPGTYQISVYGYGGSTSSYSINYGTSSDTSDSSALHNDWDEYDINDLGIINGNTSEYYEWPVESSFFGFSIDGDTNYGNWSISISSYSQLNTDYDLFLYKSDVGGPQYGYIDSSTSPGSDELINLQGVESGNYILEIQRYGEEVGTGNYKLTIESPYNIVEGQGDSFEGNNSFETASEIEVIENFYQGGLTIHDTQDVDYFKFDQTSTGAVGSYAEILLSEDSGDLDLYLYNSNGFLVDSSESAGSKETVNLAGLPKDTYTLAIRGYQESTGSYELSVNLPSITSLSDDEFENGGNNGQLDQASDLGAISGLIVIDDLTINDQGTDVDYFKFAISDLGTVANFIEMIGDSYSDSDLDISLFTTDGTLIDASSEWGSQERVSLNNLEAGSYILGINSYNERESTYKLTFNTPEATLEPLKDDAYEPNNSEEKAKKLLVSDGSLYLNNLNLSDESDVDWYEIEIPENIVDGSYIRFNSTDQTESLNITLKHEQYEDVLYRDEVPQLFSQLDLSKYVEGNYLIQVTGKQTNYELDLKIVQNNENLLIQPDRFEVNDTSGDAALLRLDDKSLLIEDLNIHNDRDEDWFRFTLPEGVTSSSGIKIQFDNAEGDLDLELYEIISDSSLVSIDQSTGTTDEESISFDGLSEGSYAAKIFAYSGNSSNYSLAIDLPSTTLSEDHFENNDDINDAYNLRTLSGVNRFDGNIHKLTDRDFFKFKTLADTTIAHSAALESDVLLSLNLYDSSGIRLKEGLGSISLEDLQADTSYLIEVAGTDSNAELGNYSLSLQLPSQIATDQPGNTEDIDGLSDWTMMVYVTADDLDYYAYTDINEMEDAINRFNIGANIAIYWDQSADGRSNPYSTGNGSQEAWTTAGKAFIVADSDFSEVATHFIISEDEVNTGDPESLYEFITWAAAEAPAENYGLVMWNHGGGVYGFNFDNSDNAPKDFLRTPELVEVLEKSQDDGINFDLIAFDECLMAMIEVGYELREYTDYFVAAEEIVGGNGYDYTTAFSAFESELGSVSPEELAQSLVLSFEEHYVRDGNEADTLSAVNTNQLELVAQSLKAFTEVARQAPEDERGAMSSLRDETVSYTSLFGTGYEKNYVDLGDWLKKVSRSQVISEEIRNLAGSVLEAIEQSVEFKTRDSRNSQGLAIYFPATSKSEDPIGEFGIPYESDYENFLNDTGWYSFIGTLAGLSGSTSQLATSRSFNLISDNASISRPLDLGLLSGFNNRIPLSPDKDNSTLFYEFEFEGNADINTTVQQVGLIDAEIAVRTVGNEKILASGTDSITLSGLDAGAYLVSINGDKVGAGINPELVINVPEAESEAEVTNSSLNKAQDLGLIASQRLLTGGLISTGQEAYYLFDTPKFPSELNYNLELFSGGSVELAAKLLSTDGETLISESKGVGTIEINHRASGQGESYIFMVSSPEMDQTSENIDSTITTSFSTSVVVESEPIAFIESPKLPTINSIHDVQTEKSISTFTLENAIQIKGQEIETIIIGTKKKDKIIGSSAGEIIAGQKNKDVLKGGDGGDGFLFNITNGFGSKKADTIKDFDSDEGDAILVNKDIFGLGNEMKFKRVRGNSKAKKAAKTKNDFIYDYKKGQLYFNEDGKEKGWGDGGLFAKLQGKPDLYVEDFMIV